MYSIPILNRQDGHLLCHTAAAHLRWPCFRPSRHELGSCTPGL